MKKLVLGIILVVVISFVVHYVYLSKNNYLFKVEDISCFCAVNTLYVYKDKDYQIVNRDGEVVDSGEVPYKNSMDYLVKMIKSYDKGSYGYNYKVSFANGDIYKISITESDELNEFISLIGTKIFKN